MSDVNNHEEEILDNTYVTLVIHQFKLECLGDRLQKKENATATRNDKWRRGDKAMRHFTDSTKILKWINLSTIVGVKIGHDGINV
ncbi:hypothetical protein F2Q69_00027918 [Brassica cretica]|uniref:Uncharacterized protein n=1 Tax=Brassica cretica TaxID=69181 RepID=A0A8S9S873_BRACR|nr:hypothetical protein F2Q69_00027918 [Brassica cretica]